jgi:hypothetical protein
MIGLLLRPVLSRRDQTGAGGLGRAAEVLQNAFPLDDPAGNEFDDAAYNMAAISATVALYRALVKKGVLTREEARQVLLDAAIARSIEAEALTQEPGVSRTTREIDGQSIEILKFIAEHL